MGKNKFIGQFSRNLDSKNRIALPSQFKSLLGERFFLTIGIDGQPEIRSFESFENFSNLIAENSIFNSNARILRRTLFGSSQEIELDTQGRFIIPKHFLEKGAFQKEIIFIGMGDYIELWDPISYEKYEKEFDTTKIISASETFAKGDKNND